MPLSVCGDATRHYVNEDELPTEHMGLRYNVTQCINSGDQSFVSKVARMEVPAPLQTFKYILSFSPLQSHGMLQRAKESYLLKELKGILRVSTNMNEQKIVL